MKKVLLVGLVTAGLFFVTGCEQKTPQKKAQESIEKAAKDTSAALQDTAKKAEDAAKKAR